MKSGFAFVYFEDEQDKMLSITSIIGHLDMTGAGYLWNGLRYDSERGDRCRDSPPRRGSYGRHCDSPYWKSPSLGYRRRPSPDYGHPRSPVYDRYNGPVYDRCRSPGHGRNASPEYGRYRSRSPMQR